MKEEKDETSKAKRTEGEWKKNLFFPLIGEKARGIDKKDEPNQTTGDRTQGKEKAKTDRE